MPSKRKVIVGIFLVSGFLLFSFGLFLIGDRRLLFSESLEIQTEFNNLSGLKNGAPVRVSGMDAGEVLAISVPGGPESKFRVRFRILETFRSVLRTDSVATIQTDGLVGNKILTIGAGTSQAPPVTPGGTIPSREPFEFDDLLQQTTESMKKANEAVNEIMEGMETSIQTLSEVGSQATQLMVDVGNEMKGITGSGNKIAQQVSGVIDEVQAGKGSVGKLLKDDEIYTSIKGTLGDFNDTVSNMKQTSQDLNETVAQLKAGGIVEDLEKVAQNVREITDQAKDTLGQLKPKGEGDGLMTDLRETVANTREATADLSENMEAMKRSWFFRGFFKDRGFYDLKDVSVEEYQSAKFAPNHVRERKWLHEHELFVTTADGREELSEEGRKNLDRAMADFLRYVPKVPVVVEGYAARGSEAEQALRSRERGLQVRKYLRERFELKANYVGVMAMGAVPSSGPQGEPWEGVAIVVLLQKEQAHSGTDPRMLVPQDSGWRPRIGGLPTDSGFALGAEAWRARLAGGSVDVGLLALGSLKKYTHGEVYFGLPRLANGRLFTAFTARYRNYPEENFFGPGPDSREGDRSNFRLEDADYSGTFGFRPLRRVRTGVTGGLMLVNVGPGKDARDPSTEQLFSPLQIPGLDLQPDFGHVGAFLEYDSRDGPSDPRSGGVYELRWTHYDDRTFNRFSFRRYDADLRHFFPLRDRRDAIALRGLLVLTDAYSGQRVPFFLQPTVGGSGELRGFRQYRFRDNNALAFNLEYRRSLNPFLDLVAFGDAGKVFPETSQFGLDDLEGSAGLGSRIKLGKQVFFGLDLGWSREGLRLWVRGGHTF